MFFLVPLSGDIIETQGGVKHTVLSYAPYKDQPAVYVDGTPSHINFSEIIKINDTPVKLGAGQIFEAGTKIARPLQLPQRLDKITIDGIPSPTKVKSIKLRDHGDFSKGIVIVGEDAENVRLADIARIERASGSEQFTRREFTKLYSDYLGFQGKNT